jgi:hypothetical protein
MRATVLMAFILSVAAAAFAQTKILIPAPYLARSMWPLPRPRKHRDRELERTRRSARRDRASIG